MENAFWVRGALFHCNTISNNWHNLLVRHSGEDVWSSLDHSSVLQFAKSIYRSLQNSGKRCYGQIKPRLTCIRVMARRKCGNENELPKVQSIAAHLLNMVVVCYGLDMYGCHRYWHTYLHWWCNCWWQLHKEFWGVSKHLICSGSRKMPPNPLDTASSSNKGMIPNILLRQHESFSKLKNGKLLNDHTSTLWSI